jgi:predicted O-methyltransferase YrrM
MGGPIYNAVMEKVAHLPLIKDYMIGTIDKVTFQQELLKSRDQFKTLGVGDWWLGLLARFPNDPWEGVRLMTEQLSSSGILAAPEAEQQAYQEYEQQVRQQFSHLPDRFTSIFPEETRIAHALSRARKPESIFVAGSYYGYLAVWLIPGLAAGGQMILSDVDPTVCALAQRNMEAMGAGSRVTVMCEDAEKLLQSGTDPIDLFVLDAYGGHTHPDPRYHGKAIYAPLLKAALPHLHEKSILLVHNAERNSEDLAEFFTLVKDARFSIYLNTTENMAVFQL